MPTYENLYNQLIVRAENDEVALNDAFSLLREIEKTNYDFAHAHGVDIRKHSALLAKKNGSKQMLDLNKKALLFDAKNDLDCYLRALESNRPFNEQFYMPRRKVLKSFVDSMQDLVDDKLDELFLNCPPRVGKLLADSTPVLTTKGWKKHGDLQVGDYVYNHEGKAVPVVYVHPKHHTTHTVTMTDGSQFKCHFRHEWLVYDRKNRKERVMETQQMMKCWETGKPGERGHRYHYQLPIKQPLEGDKHELHVKPYTLGAWLGDGTNQKPRLNTSMEDVAITEAIADEGYEFSKFYLHKDTAVMSVEFKGLSTDLQKYDMCWSRRRCIKHIPQEYLTATIEERLELLAGLMDTDGSLRRDEHRYTFSTTEPQLRDDLVSLISTFGWRVCVCEYEPHTSSFGIVGKKTCWTISFNPTMEIPCRVERKQLKEFSKQRRVAIASIEESEPEQGNCITVEGGIYLVGERLIPTHNTSLLMFFVTWILGKYPEKSNLYSAFSDIITSAFYNGVLEVINDPTTYCWHEIFPESKIVRTNSKDETIDIDRAKRYPTLTCRSLYGTLNGAVDCNGFLISDDLIGGIEEALNKDRMVSAWSKVDNNMIPRAKQGAKLLWCGTRWSIIDPAGLRIDLLQHDQQFANRRFKVLRIPALDEHDESNFNYLYNVGFSTEFYKQRRASFERNNDMASWLAQYQNEPIERQGALFEPQDMNFYNGVLPDEEHLVRVFMAVDPAYGGGDFTAAPVCYQYEDGRIYVHDVVFSDGDKNVTQPLIVSAVQRNKVNAIQFEANKSTLGYKENVEDMLKKQGLKVHITTKVAPNNKSKEQRIYDKAPEIREMYFLEEGKRSKEYEMFMQNVYSFTITGRKVKHDDAPDALAQAVDMVVFQHNKIEVFRKTW